MPDQKQVPVTALLNPTSDYYKIVLTTPLNIHGSARTYSNAKVSSASSGVLRIHEGNRSFCLPIIFSEI
jgi:hypothetical protein